LAGGRRRRAPGAGGSDAGIEGAGGRRFSSISTWSTGSSGAAAQKSSGYSPADGKRLGSARALQSAVSLKAFHHGLGPFMYHRLHFLSRKKSKLSGSLRFLRTYTPAPSYVSSPIKGKASFSCFFFFFVRFFPCFLFCFTFSFFICSIYFQILYFYL
jgi:hypothetical protein